MKPISFKAFLMLSLLGTLIFACKQESKKVISTKAIEFSKEGNLSIFKKDTDSIIAQLAIEIAETAYETQTGLMYRKGMEPKQGMLFIFPSSAVHSFYMKNTEFSLDLLFIDENNSIASMQENAEPFNESPLSSKVPIKYVLEINGGLAQEWNLQLGDSISFERD